jgi:hypothetical protein
MKQVNKRRIKKKSESTGSSATGPNGRKRCQAVVFFTPCGCCTVATTP